MGDIGKNAHNISELCCYRAISVNYPPVLLQNSITYSDVQYMSLLSGSSGSAAFMLSLEPWHASWLSYSYCAPPFLPWCSAVQIVFEPVSIMDHLRKIRDNVS